MKRITSEVWAMRGEATLRQRLAAMGLNPDAVIRPDGDGERYERRLRALLLWAEAHRHLGSREAMLHHRYLFPPVDPGADADEEWARFEDWLASARRTEAAAASVSYG
ncbi:MAG: hypothetical protein N2652_05835 [Kiritimatiellae bacterium]|nr:hypothetical protein [Kiritimatiellia bacterium]